MSLTSSFLRRPIEAPWSALNFLRVLGEGRYGTVWLCEDSRSGEKFACKKVLKESLKDSLLLQHFLRQEVALLDSFAGKNPNIIELKYVFEDNDAVYLMMEFCDAGDLFSYVLNGASVPESRCSSSVTESSGGSGIGDGSPSTRTDGNGENVCDNLSCGAWRGSSTWGLPESKAVWIFRQVAQAVLFCHRNGVMHRDIKLENVLLCRPFNAGGGQYYCYSALPPPVLSLPKAPNAPDSRVLAKLADFGLALKLAQGEKTIGAAGSRLYEAPEVLLGEEYDLKADVWSLGVLLFGLLSCSMPFQGQSDRQLIRQVVKAHVDLSKGSWTSVSQEAKDLITRMLCVNPDVRLSMEEVVNHPWLKSSSRRRKAPALSSVPLSLASAPTTPKSPCEIVELSSAPSRNKRSGGSDLPSLDPCRGEEEEERENQGFTTPRQVSGAECAQKDAVRQRRKSASACARDEPTALPPLPPTTPKASTNSSGASKSPGGPTELSVNVAVDRSSKGRSMLDSWFPAFSPGKGKWRMGF
eukprot:TRINITY_DN5772_c0_g1_i1.p1 TRINITY_DN5772_c0_g1~~TRINITY_DN5772_c0_g1_i1.p1  ORF type:complete len:525 (-),score=37.27 TRINITY_DN5772_c0_g1_i1:397-1971(-)